MLVFRVSILNLLVIVAWNLKYVHKMSKYLKKLKANGGNSIHADRGRSRVLIFVWLNFK